MPDHENEQDTAGGQAARTDKLQREVDRLRDELDRLKRSGKVDLNGREVLRKTGQIPLL